MLVVGVQVLCGSGGHGDADGDSHEDGDADRDSGAQRDGDECAEHADGDGHDGPERDARANEHARTNERAGAGGLGRGA